MTDCSMALNLKCPNIVQHVTETNIHMEKNLRHISAVDGQRVLKNIIQTKNESLGCFPAACVCINCGTKTLHTEKDCSFTAIHVPNQRTEHDNVHFQLYINENESILVGLHPKVSILLSSYLQTHRQVGKFERHQKFYNIVAFSNKRLYDCFKMSFDRLEL